MRALPLILLLACTTYDGTWTVTGAAPEPFATEVQRGADAVRVVMGVPVSRWGGEVTVVPAPFFCGDILAVGCSYNEHDITVTYAPELGLGPEMETTAVLHELCHAALDVLRNDLREEPAYLCAAKVAAWLSVNDGLPRGGQR